MTRPSRHAALTCLALGVCACDVPAPPRDTGGVASASSGDCARGLVVVSSDYQSSNVSLLALDGAVLSSSFISSASRPPGLSAALSGDVVTPSSHQPGSELVLIDRYPAGVVSYIDLTTSEVRAQLPVNTGFAANPHDYLAVSATKAYVTRFETNHTPGREAFDEGGDVLIVDPREPTITGRVDLSAAVPADGGFLPHPDRLLRVGDFAYVLLGAYAADFATSAPTRLAVIDVHTDALVRVVELAGLHACAGMAVAPDATELAVACSGDWGGDSVASLDTSGVVRLRAEPTLEEIARYPAAEVADAPLTAAIAYSGPGRLLLGTYGRFASGALAAEDDTLFELDLNTGAAREVLRSAREPFTLGDVRCDVPCAVCFAADAHRDGGVVHRLAVGSTGLATGLPLVVDEGIGLPPRALGTY